MVTNAQFPEQIESLIPVTQLYVSIDAPTEDTLKKIDRPLFKDFWQRFFFYFLFIYIFLIFFLIYFFFFAFFLFIFFFLLLLLFL